MPPKLQLNFQPTNDMINVMIIGKIASPNENPSTDIEVALPLFCPNQRPIATEGKWNNIPWPKNLNPKIIPINIQRDELNTIAKHKIDKLIKKSKEFDRKKNVFETILENFF